MLMLMTSSRIDTEDPGAVPGASTMDTPGPVRKKLLIR